MRRLLKRNLNKKFSIKIQCGNARLKRKERKMKRNTVKRIIAAVVMAAIVGVFSSCGGAFGGSSESTYKIGICNYVDDASLNQIADSIKSRIQEAETERGITVEVLYENCNGDQSVMSQIISNFQVESVDLMVAIATPVAVTMQAATEGFGTPVVFAAVSDPVSAGLVESLERPGANVTGTSDYLDTKAILDLIFALDPDATNVGLLYDVGQDSSATPIKEAKEYLDAKGVKYIESTGTTVDEIALAADSLVADNVDAVFTPTDNTVMKSELAIYEKFANAGIPHYTGADSFALNGAFLGYGVDYENLGKKTADMVVDILVDGKDPAEYPVLSFDNGTATVNIDICIELGFDFDNVHDTFAPYCTKVESIVTAESFDDIG